MPVDMPLHSKSGGVTTLADVGRAAGVSIATVSIVLNRPWCLKNISPATRERIRAAAAELRYRPNLAARALVSRRIHTIGVVAVVEDGEFDDYFLEVFNGIVTTAAGRGQSTTAFTLRSWESASERLRDFCDGRIDGIILLAPTFEAGQVTLPAHTPFVSIHGNCALPGVVNVESDEEEGAFILVRHLIDRGHSRILHLAGPEGFIGAERRIQGYKRALAAARIPFNPSLVVRTGYRLARGRETMRRWVQEHAGAPLPHAVFCANDFTAIGCCEALAEVGLRVPEDISVAGFDDTFAARSVVPQLTSVRQPLREMGARAVELLLARITHAAPLRKTPPPPVVFPVKLALRASVGSPPAREPVARPPTDKFPPAPSDAVPLPLPSIGGKDSTNKLTTNLPT